MLSSSLGLGAPLNSAWGSLGKRSVLEKIGFEVDIRPDDVPIDSFSARLLDDEVVASIAGRLLQSLARRRIFRSAWLLYGWPARFQLLGTQEDETIRAARELHETYARVNALDGMFFEGVYSRRPERLVAVHHLMQPLKYHGWRATDRIRNRAKKIASGFKQSRLVECGFWKERRAEATAANATMSDMGVWMALVESSLLTSRFEFDTVANSSLEYAPNAALDPQTFMPQMRRCSIKVEKIKGAQRDTSFLTHTPFTWTRHHLEPMFMINTRRLNQWNLAPDIWLQCLLPDSQPVLLRPAGGEQWELVLGVCPGAATCTWPVRQVRRTPACCFFEPVHEGRTPCSFQHVCSLQWEIWNCIWASPLQQRGVLGAPPEDGGDNVAIRLATVGAPEDIVRGSARHGFWKAKEQDVRNVAIKMELRDIAALEPYGRFMEAFVRHLHPDLNDMEVYAICIKPAQNDAFVEDLLADEENCEFLDRGDREKLQQERNDRKSAEKRQKRYLASLAGLRDRARSMEDALLEQMASDTRRGGVIPYISKPDELTQALANEWGPPKSHVSKDFIAKRWQMRWQFGNISRAWATHGFVESLLAVLQAAWRSHNAWTGLRCDIPGLFPADDDVYIVIAQPAAAPEGRGRGRARGRGGRGGKGAKAGRAAAPAAPAALADAPPVPGAEDEEPSSAASSDDSSSSGSSSS